jgi:fatty acid-binding protein DegV
MSDWDKPTEDMVNEMLDRKTLIKTQVKEIEKLRAALREIKKRTQDAHPMSYVADYWRIAKEARGEKE